jgi:hypothetical protein
LGRLAWGAWSGFYWLRIGTDGGLLWTRWWTFGLWRHGQSVDHTLSVFLSVCPKYSPHSFALSLLAIFGSESISRFLQHNLYTHFTKYCWDRQIKEDKMGGELNTH